MKRLLIGDAFCGGGGTATGARIALRTRGLNAKIVSINHDHDAIRVHSANHPDAEHFRSNIYKLDPREAVPEGELDLLMASPTCTYFSRARGGRPISRDQRYGRMTPTQVVRWCKELKVKRLLVENVPEFVEWGPVSRSAGRPIKKKRGVYFRAWIKKLERLGFRLEWRILNAADYGDVTTRRRFFLLGRADGREIRWPEPTHSRDGSSDLMGGGARKWRPAREVIDWSLEGQSIFDRERPLARKTLERILAGAERFGWGEPFLVLLRRHMDGRSLDEPLPTLTAGGNHVGLARPFLFANRSHNVPKPTDEAPAPGITTTTGGGIGLVEAVQEREEALVVRTAMHKSNALCVRTPEDPLPTVTTDGGLAVVEPFVLPQGRNSPAKSVEDPVPALVAIARVGLAEPFVLNRNGDNGTTRAHSTDAPMPTATSRGAGYLVEPFVLSQGGGGAPRATTEPLPTIPTEGAHALVAPYYGASDCKSVEEPLGTVTTRDRFGLVMPVTHQDGSRRARSTDEPLPTVTGAARGELAFIAAQFGERKGQRPRVHSVEEPTPSICAKGRVQLVRGASLERFGIDIRFRMLEPHELAAAMGFPKDYKWDGTKTTITRLIGNAVAVNQARALVDAILWDVA